jgi:hypothetical protein
VIRKIQQRFTLRQFLRIVRRANRSGDFPAAIDRMIASCTR